MLHNRTLLAAGPAFTLRKSALFVLALGVLTALLIPAATATARPTIYDRFEARQTCISERGTDIVKRREFRMLYGRNPFRKCVRFHARTIAMERRIEAPLIPHECRLARAEDPIGFRQEYPGGIRMCVRMESMP
jgi:hypothetical protein